MFFKKRNTKLLKKEKANKSFEKNTSPLANEDF